MDAARLFGAIAERDAETVGRSLREDPSLAKARGPWGLPPLHHALYLRASQVVDALLAAGVEPTLFESAILGDTTRVRAFVERDRALLTAQGPDGAPALHLAAHFGRVETLKALLGLGAPLDLHAGGSFGNTALHAAAAGGQADAVDALLAAGAKPDPPDKNGFTPLHVAAAGGSVPMMAALLRRGASAGAVSKDGKTPRDVARERDEDEAVALLDAHGG